MGSLANTKCHCVFFSEPAEFNYPVVIQSCPLCCGAFGDVKERALLRLCFVVCVLNYSFPLLLCVAICVQVTVASTATTVSTTTVLATACLMSE